MPREAVLVHTLVELADSLVEDFDVVDLLSLLAARCVEVLGVSAAGVMLVAPEGDLRVIASSSEAMRVVELFELQSQEGPCLDCYGTGEPVLNEDLRTVHTRWPRFATVALEAGFRTAHALPMRLRGSVVGALNLFSTDAGALAEEDMVAGQALAAVATIAILQQRVVSEARIVNDQLNHALGSRVIIEQGQGRVGRAFRTDDGGRLPGDAPVRPEPQYAPRRRRRPGGGQEPRPRSVDCAF